MTLHKITEFYTEWFSVYPNITSKFRTDKNGLIKRCPSFEYLSVFKISWSHVDWCKFCIHLRSLNVSHFGMVEGTGLKSTASRSPSIA
jgi:hypothetical protein